PLSSRPSPASPPLPRSAPHLPLHSFPTRRSSDLASIRARPKPRPLPLVLRNRFPSFFIFFPAVKFVKEMYSCVPFMSIYTRMTRSEEHTSELQSRFDLVCRLLLEKKNNVCGHHLP